MTTFENGPAKGSNLMLRRSPVFLRVVVDAKGKVDALDQPEDSPNQSEKVFVYVAVEHKGGVHINAGRGRGGFYQMVSYKLVEPQPEQAQLRTTQGWQRWADAQPKPEVKRG